MTQKIRNKYLMSGGDSNENGLLEPSFKINDTTNINDDNTSSINWKWIGIGSFIIIIIIMLYLMQSTINKFYLNLKNSISNIFNNSSTSEDDSNNVQEINTAPPPPPPPSSQHDEDDKPKNGPGWCYIGANESFRTCTEIGSNDMCMSGDVFPTEELCLNPNLRP